MKKLALLLIALATLASCNNGRIKVKTKNISIYHKETSEIVAESRQEIKYESENQFHATVDNTGLVTAVCVGDTKIKLYTEDDIEYVNVFVKPRYNLYEIPDLTFGESKQSVIQKYGQPDSYNSGGNIMYYDNYGMIGITMMVSLEGDAVDAFAFSLGSSYQSTLTGFLAERYMSIGTNNNIIYMIDALDMESAQYMIGVTYTSGHYIVLYTFCDKDLEKQLLKITER